MDAEDRILVVDDDRDIARLIQIALENEGYKVDICYDGKEALEQVYKKHYILAILDVMLPQMDGYTLCDQIRKKYFFPILMVTAKGTDMDKIKGLMMGADDYITKPFNPMELVMRVKVQLRRCKEYSKKLNDETKNKIINHEDGIYEIRGLLINQKRRECIFNNEYLELTPIEFDILCYLCKNKGYAVSSEELFEAVWKEKYLSSNNTIMAHITRIREKMKEVPRKPKYIKTVWGVGYKIEE